MKIAIIGAGVAGLCAARHASQYDFEITVFEMSHCVGGTWVYNEKTDTNNGGIDVHSSMYKNLRTNLPKEIMGYPDFNIEECEESYVSSQKICSFLENYADYYKLNKYIQFNTYVLRVLPRANKWQIISKNLNTKEISICYFDYVWVANGHYHTPSYPSLNGGYKFLGNLMHSHNYRNPDVFVGKVVLVIGAGPSGMDLSNIIAKSARKVYLSHHLSDIDQTKFLANVFKKSDVKELDECGAFFTDGSYQKFDTILFCTGYKYSFPFLSADCGIYVEDNFVQPLFKHCINIMAPTMALVGLPYYVCAAQMVDIQVRFILKYVTGVLDFPTKTCMKEDSGKEMMARFEKGYKKKHAHMMGPEQIKYYNDLAKTANVENIKPVMTKLHNESSKCFNVNLLNFRNDIFRIIDHETFVKIN